MSLRIIPYEAQYANYFRDLNLAWIKKYFHVEPKDKILLENCQEHIIDKGGYIFFADYNSQIVGCFALLPLGHRIYELSKMAVNTEHQGLKIGQNLLSKAIAFGREKQWNKIVLYSSTKLDTALHVYRKFGFLETEMEKDSEYQRSDIKMELILRSKH